LGKGGGEKWITNAERHSICHSGTTWGTKWVVKKDWGTGEKQNKHKGGKEGLGVNCFPKGGPKKSLGKTVTPGERAQSSGNAKKHRNH